MVEPSMIEPSMIARSTIARSTIARNSVAKAVRRALQRALLRLGATAVVGGLLCTVLVRFSPGFGLDERQLDARLSHESQQALRGAHDEERSTLRFYITFWKRVLTGDLGFSQSFNQPIGALLKQRAPATAELAMWGIGYAWAVALLLSLPCVSPVLRRLTPAGAVVSGMAASLPAAAIAIVVFRFGGSTRWMMAIVLFPRLYQYLRGVLTQAYGMPHVLFARAKGVNWLPLTWRHVVVPSWTQLVALAAVSVNMAFGAAVAIEAVCDVPGIGQLAWKAAAARDLPVLVVLTVLIAMLTQMANLVADCCAPWMRGEA